MQRSWPFPTTMAFVVLCCARASAADTTETFEKGAVDVALSAGADNLGPRGETRPLGAETSLGLGLIERVSMYIAGAHETDETLAAGENRGAIGLLSTPFDSDHVDFDFTLELSIPQSGFAGSVVRPGIELNLDLEPNMSSAGFYARIVEVLTSREQSDAPEGATAHEPAEVRVFSPSTDATAGSYWTPASGHQLLLEYGTAFAHNPEDESERFEPGVIALGYNVMLTDDVELISQVGLGIPADGEEVSGGVAAGVIIGFPAPGWTPSREIVAERR